MATLPSEVDVVIVGASPDAHVLIPEGGLMAGICLSRYGLKVRIVDIQPDPWQGYRGHASLQPRCCEILTSLGIFKDLTTHGTTLLRHAVRFENGKKVVEWRQYFACDSVHNYILLIEQQHLEKVLILELEKHGVFVERPCTVVNFEIGDESSEYPISAVVQNLENGETEEVVCKYILGCDGAHSTIRKRLMIAFNGTTDIRVPWAVMEAFATTDFNEDRSFDFAANITPHGSVSMARVYNGTLRIHCQMNSPDTDEETIEQSAITEEFVKRKIQVNLTPFTIKFHEIIWWTYYTVGEERLASQFSVQNRVFLIGGAAHTHSLKTANSTNLAIVDAHNLAWKIYVVERHGGARQEILDTYEGERKANVERLVELDRKISQYSSQVRPSSISPGQNSTIAKELKYLYDRNLFVISGVGIEYGTDNALVVRTSSSLSFIPELKILAGQRAFDGDIIRAEDGSRIRLYDVIPSIGGFKVLTMAGDLSVTRRYLKEFGEYLDSSMGFFQQYFSTDNRDIIEFVTLTVTGLTQQPDLRFLPPILQRMYIDTEASRTSTKGTTCHQIYGVDESKGAIIIVRPDGWVGACVDLENYGVLDRYFERFLSPRTLVLV